MSDTTGQFSARLHINAGPAVCENDACALVRRLRHRSPPCTPQVFIKRSWSTANSPASSACGYNNSRSAPAENACDGSSREDAVRPWRVG